MRRRELRIPDHVDAFYEKVWKATFPQHGLDFSKWWRAVVWEHCINTGIKPDLGSEELTP